MCGATNQWKQNSSNVVFMFTCAVDIWKLLLCMSKLNFQIFKQPTVMSF